MEAICTTLPGITRSVSRAATFQTVHEPLPWFKTSMMEVLSTAVFETGASKGVICWPGFGDVRAYGRRAPKSVVPICASIAASDTWTHVHPFVEEPLPSYERKAGPMLLLFDSAEPQIGPVVLDELARRVHRLIGRHELHARAARTCGVDITSVVVGNAEAVGALESAIAKVAQSDLPVLIEAEFGSDVVAIAAAIHCQGLRRDESFVVFNCACKSNATFRSSLMSALESAAGGSLLLSDVDMLNEVMQKDLLDVLSSEVPGVKASDVRLLSTATEPLESLIDDGRFCRFLRTHLELLKIEVPPLRQRKRDISMLIEQQIMMHHHARKRLAEDVKAVCEEYPWPGNFAELKKVVSRLAVMSEKECITMEDLAVHTPFLIRRTEWTDSAVPEPQLPEPQDGPAMVPELEPEMEQDIEAISELALSLAMGNHANLARYGIGVQRALVYVSRQYQAEITLSELAANAYLSVSHLSFLFKKTVGVPFKTLLACVRIEKAKQLLAENPDLSVTEVSLNSGFGDLSHFERTFKRIVGVNPREYRRKMSSVRSGGARIVSRGEERRSLASIQAARRLPLEERKNSNPRQVCGGAQVYD